MGNGQAVSLTRPSVEARAQFKAAPTSRPWAVASRVAALLPFALTGALYESLRGAFRAHGPVHVADLWRLEQRWFGVPTEHGTRALSQVIASHTNIGLDVWCGATYVLFLLQSVAVCCYLLTRSKARAWQLSLGFLVINLLGWLIWIVYPAAPPWYVDQYGLQPVVSDVVSSPAGLLRFDALLGLPVTETFYSKSANVFGAMPSLHVAYATLVVCVVWSRAGWLRSAAVGFALSMAFSAVYLRHHYLLDVLAGALLALVVYSFSEVVRRRAQRLAAVPRSPAAGAGP